MAPKFFFTATLSLASISMLSAQTPVEHLRYAGLNESNVNTLVTQLEQNALQLLMIATVFTAIIWIGYIVLECRRLNKKINGKQHLSSVALLAMALSLNLLGSGCSIEKMTYGAKAQEGKAAESGVCVCPNYNNRTYYGNMGLQNSQYPYHNFGQINNGPYCKQCNLRRYNRNY